MVQPPIIQSWTRGDLEAWRILHSKASTTIVNSNLTVSLLLEDNSRILHALKVIDVPAVWKHGFENILVFFLIQADKQYSDLLKNYSRTINLYTWLLKSMGFLKSIQFRLMLL